MPSWLAVPFEDKERRHQLQVYYNINVAALPQVVVLDDDEKMSTITGDGVYRISTDTWGLQFPWRQPNVIDVASLGERELNTTPSMILLAEAEDLGKQEAKELWKIQEHVAKAHVEKCSNSGKLQDILYFYAKSNTSVSMGT